MKLKLLEIHLPTRRIGFDDRDYEIEIRKEPFPHFWTKKRNRGIERCWSVFQAATWELSDGVVHEESSEDD